MINDVKEVIFYQAYKLLWHDLEAFLAEDSAVLTQIIVHGLIGLSWEAFDLNGIVDRRTRFLRKYFSSLPTRPWPEITSNFKTMFSILQCLQQVNSKNYIEIEHKFLESSWKRKLTPLSDDNLADLIEVV